VEEHRCLSPETATNHCFKMYAEATAGLMYYWVPLAGTKLCSLVKILQHKGMSSIASVLS
jgi:hypothetical protein